jgi:hypothetical protein
MLQMSQKDEVNEGQGLCGCVTRPPSGAHDPAVCLNLRCGVDVAHCHVDPVAIVEGQLPTIPPVISLGVDLGPAPTETGNSTPFR